MELTCPKCQGAMRQYERNGVHVDQCGECRGIFLDRGELERLVDAEAAFASRTATPPPPAAAPQPQPAQYQSPQHQPAQYQAPQHQAPQYDSRQRYGQEQHGGYRPKKKKSFFEELFD